MLVFAAMGSAQVRGSSKVGRSRGSRGWTPACEEPDTFLQIFKTRVSFFVSIFSWSNRPATTRDVFCQYGESELLNSL